MVEAGTPGFKVETIKNKYALRMVQNGDLTFTDVFIPDNNRLEKARDFMTGAGLILLQSRLSLSWMICGIAAGAYEAALRYTMQRTQFGKPIAAF